MKEKKIKTQNQKELKKPKSKVKPNFTFFLVIKKVFNFLFSFSDEMRKVFLATFLVIFIFILVLSFFELAGSGGIFLYSFLNNLYGSFIYFIPFLLLLLIVFLKTKSFKFVSLYVLPLFVFSSFVFSSFLIVINRDGGEIGALFSGFLIFYFDRLASGIIILSLILVPFLFFYYKPIIKLIYSAFLSLKKLYNKGQEQKKLDNLKDFAKEDFLVKKETKIDSNIPKQSEINLSNQKNNIDKVDIYNQNTAINKYESPPISLLASEKAAPSLHNIEENEKIIQKTLEHFNIPVKMSSVSVGPTVTQYSLKPVQGIKLSKITGLSNDLALALAAHPIRIEAPIPGQSLVGIEVPNKTRIKITLRSLLEKETLKKEGSKLDDTFYIPLGRDVAGIAVYFNLFKMPHLLVAGATGTGKTVFLNSLITGLIFRNSPDTLKLILIDPKRVEFANYNDLPHLLCPVISDPKKAINALNWLIIEMERRFDMLLELGVRDISTYNKIIEEKKRDDELQSMPYIVLVLDELADLMNISGKDLEAKIMRLAQKARAVGIHLVLATQRPSVNVITGVIKANIVARIAFTVVSQIDSRTILDAVGAEKLIGSGDMLFMSPSSPYPKRIQGAYISEQETDKIVDWISLNVDKKKDLSDTLSESLEEVLRGEYDNSQMNFQVNSSEDTFFDPFYEDAKQVILESDRASTSLLQRRLKIGYARAARLIDMMEQKGFVGPARGSKPRKILIDKLSEG